MTGDEILAGLLDPGRQLLFVDDSGTSGKPLPDLAADFRLLAGVQIPSDRYPHVKAQMQALRAPLPFEIAEFHIKELINPSEKSAWRKVSIDERLKTLASLLDLVTGNVERVLYCFVSGEQFKDELRPRLVAGGSKIKDHEVALEQVFFTRALDHIRKSGGEAAIIFDSDVALVDELMIQTLARPEGIYQSGIIRLDSREEEGLQLADFVAFGLNRLHHARQKAIDGRANEFDEFFVNAISAMTPKIINVLQGV